MSPVSSPVCKHVTSDRWRAIAVPDFTQPPNWLSHPPDLNPIDYSIRGALQQLIIVRRSRTLTKSWTVAGSRSAKNCCCWPVVRCCWSFVLRVDTLSIFFSSVMFACCKFLFCDDNNDSVEHVAGIDVFWVLHLPTVIRRKFNYNIHILSIFVLPVNFWTF